MKKKPAKRPYKPTLHECELVPITDPAIQAAIDKMARMKNPKVPAILREHARKSREERERRSANGQ